jgi:hypothetical protein
VATPSNAKADSKNPVIRNQPPDMRVSCSIFLVIGLPNGDKVQALSVGDRNRWTLLVSFVMKRRDQSRRGAARWALALSQRNYNNVN